MFSVFGVTADLYFIEILRGSSNMSTQILLLLLMCHPRWSIIFAPYANAEEVMKIWYSDTVHANDFEIIHCEALKWTIPQLNKLLNSENQLAQLGKAS